MAPVNKVKSKAKSAKHKRSEAASLSGQVSMFDDLKIRHPEGALYSPLATDDELFGWLERLDHVDKLCLDIETSAPDGRPKGSLNPWVGEVRTIQVGLTSGDVLILDCHLCRSRPMFVMLMDRLKELCWDPGCLIIGHSLKFEMTWLRVHYGFRFNRVMCLDVASRILWAGMSEYGAPMRHSMDALAGRLLGKNVDKTQQNSAWKNPKLTQLQLNYAADDVRIPFRCMAAIMPIIREFDLIETCRLEFEALIVYAEMEVDGIPVNGDRLTELLELYTEALAVSRVLFDQQFPGVGLHCSSRAYNGEAPLGEEYSYPAGLYDGLYKLTREWPETLNAEYLEPLSRVVHENGSLRYPAIDSLMVSRALYSSVTYLQKIKDGFDGSVVRPGYRSLAPQGRGRSTSGSAGEGSNARQRLTTGEVLPINIQNPPNGSKARYKDFKLNGQNLPEVRSVFAVGPGTGFEGRVMDCFDFAGAHSRFAAVATMDPFYIECLWDDSIDFHCDLAALIGQQNGTTWDGAGLKAVRKGVDKGLAALATSLRNVAKNQFYLWLNGGGEGRTIKNVNVGGFQCPDPIALLDSLKSRFTGVADFHSRVKQDCRDRRKWRSFPAIGITQPHLMIRSMDGRIVWVPAKDSDYGVACNPNDVNMVYWMCPESSAKKRAMVSIRKLVYDNPQWGLVLWLDCHDELGVHCLKEWAHIALPACDEAMDEGIRHFLNGVVPTRSDPYKFQDNLISWDQCK